MLLEALAQAIEPRCLGHLRKSLGQLFLRVKNIPQFVEEQLVYSLGHRERRTLGLNQRLCLWIDRRERRGRHELPVASFIPRASGIDLSLVSGAGGIVEELAHEA